MGRLATGCFAAAFGSFLSSYGGIVVDTIEANLGHDNGKKSYPRIAARIAQGG
jgi:hypothetical protein